jgi:small subunit ribosomal protein S9
MTPKDAKKSEVSPEAPAEDVKKEVKKPRKTLARADRPLEVKEDKPSKKAKQSQEYKLPSGKYYYANGKRKTSVARVRLYKGDGSIFINEKPINKFCATKVQVELIGFPLQLTGTAGKFNITAKVTGGGPNSQAEAVRHGIAKALEVFDETLRPTLKHAGLLTRDPRSKERKKYGLKKARRGPQFSKR